MIDFGYFSLAKLLNCPLIHKTWMKPLLQSYKVQVMLEEALSKVSGYDW